MLNFGDSKLGVGGPGRNAPTPPPPDPIVEYFNIW